MAIEINLSDRCNLKCSWCYMGDAGASKGCGQGPNWDRTKSYLEWYFYGQKEDHLKHITPGVVIMGGEPTYEWGDLEKTVEWCKQNPVNGKEISINMTTNVTLLNEERIIYLKQNNVKLQLGVDGCPEAQDMYRVYADGSGTSSIVDKNLRLLVKYGQRSARLTYAPNNVEFLYKSILYLYEDIGLSNVAYVPTYQSEGWTEDKLSIMKTQLELITEWYIDKVKKTKKTFPLFHLRNAGRIIDSMKNGRRGTGCSRSLRTFAVDTLGNIWPCHRFCNSNAPLHWSYGNVNQGGITNTTMIDIIKKTQQIQEKIYNKPECSTCVLQGVCNANCWGEIMTTSHSISEGTLQFDIPFHKCEHMKIEYITGKKAFDELQPLGFDAYPKKNKNTTRRDDSRTILTKGENNE